MTTVRQTMKNKAGLLGIALILVVGFTAYTSLRGRIQVLKFSHDLQLLGYQGFQGVVRLPAWYRSHPWMNYNLWYEVLDPKQPDKVLESSHSGPGGYDTGVIPRNLPVDILLHWERNEAEQGQWHFQSLLNMGGTMGILKELPELCTSGVSTSNFKPIPFREGEPMLIAEFRLGNWNTPQDLRVVRWYLEIDLTTKDSKS